MLDGPVAAPASSEWSGVREGDVASGRALGPLAATVAEFEGECAGCGFSVAMGDTIVLVDGAGWVHERCGK
jgi:hypothetical protein